MLHRDVDGLELYDAHVHIGLDDPAGLLATAGQAIEALEQVGSRALIFPLQEPGGYREPNEHMVVLAESHPDRLRALCRLDPADDPLAEPSAASTAERSA